MFPFRVGIPLRCTLVFTPEGPRYMTPTENVSNVWTLNLLPNGAHIPVHGGYTAAVYPCFYPGGPPVYDSDREYKQYLDSDSTAKRSSYSRSGWVYCCGVPLFLPRRGLPEDSRRAPGISL